MTGEKMGSLHGDMAADKSGNVYLSAGDGIHVFGPDGKFVNPVVFVEHWISKFCRQLVRHFCQLADAVFAFSNFTASPAARLSSRSGESRYA